jgi:6-phosphogluconate dehydrogenase
MELAMIGLGRMGANMAQRLMRGGHRVVGYDPAQLRAPGTRSEGRAIGGFARGAGAETQSAAHGLAHGAGRRDHRCDRDRAEPLLAAGDTIIDGGNSNYRDTQRRAASVAARKIDYVDSGTSGGVWGLAEGYSLMIGGDEAVVERLRRSSRRSRRRRIEAGAASGPSAPVTTPR